MKIVVIGGSGLIGSKLVDLLKERGHEAVPASPSTGVNSVTGEGLADALQGAHVVVDVTNSPSFEDGPVLEFFETSTRNLLDAEAAAGVRHHVALSIVGTDQLPESGYLRAKHAQERLITASGIPYSIVRATQFFEFVGAIAEGSTVDGVVHVPAALIQPVAAADVSAFLAEVASGEPRGTVELGGPERFSFAELISAVLPDRKVVVEPDGRYFGTPLKEDSLTTGPGATLAGTRLVDWQR
ncbi:Uncharacterized conserved protein YbjT, contains NAD(P)-binding and DUF2867 domains [Amycolatopsis sacchari]|uniref:Uncharacterized conserved protein YbjT, contains NAD(P)-binding and DUF2867 domains n=1 Tax=Amycolatopsis sacchari TaxID=115433 RepID=A0A1I3XEB8_9PSEU|nr:NAD(P)H-binding protein [Amycolatopsis sacchari]SFK17854.1 Uncharacterized conserved protein YbjT, contains NAD(P)-binding and DUF2867 domains [Amycolatopsis sacchari]